MKIHDGFSFLNEVDLLEVRLHELSEVTDTITILEATTTFSGLKKPLIWESVAHRFKPFLDKIQYVVLDEPMPEVKPETLPETESEARIYRQNDFLLRAMVKRGAPGDWFIISDLDEIPRASLLKECPFLPMRNRLLLDYHYYKLNWRKPVNYTPTRVVPYEMAAAMSYQEIRWPIPGSGFTDNAIFDAGWHFTYMGGRDVIRKKLKSIAAAASPGSGKFLSNLDGPVGKWMFREQLFKVPIETLPLYVQQNEQSFRDRGMLE